MSPIIAQAIVVAFVSAVIGAALGTVIGIFGMRDVMTTVRVRLESHMGESRRRFARLEQIVGLTGEEPRFIPRTESELTAKLSAEQYAALTGQLERLVVGQTEIRDRLVALEVK